MKRVERTALPKATSNDLKDLCEGASFKCPKCLKMISLKWWSLYNNNNIWSFPSCTASLLSNSKFGPGMQIFNDLLCCQNPSVSSSTYHPKLSRKLFYCGASQHHNAQLRRCSRTDDARVVKWDVFSVRVLCNWQQSHHHLSCQDATIEFSLFTALCTCFLPYGELTVRHLQNLTQFGSTLVNISFPFIKSKEKIG